MKVSISLCAFALILTATACKSKKKVTLAERKPIDVNYGDKKEVMRGILERKQEFQFLSFDSKAEISGTPGNYNVDFTFKMKRGDTIWTSMSVVFGIEAMRILVTRDSVFMLNKLNRTYQQYDLGYFEQIVGKKVTVTDLQDILIGNSIFIGDSNASYEEKENTVTFEATSGYHIREEFLKSLLRPVHVNAENHLMQQSFKLDYENYAAVESFIFPYGTIAEAKSAENEYYLKLNHSSFSFAPITSYPFKIPANYDRKN